MEVPSTVILSMAQLVLMLALLAKAVFCKSMVNSLCTTAEAICLNTNLKKGSPYSITERRVLELILVLGSQPAGDASHKLGSRLPLLSARPAVTPATLKRAATNFAAW